MKISVIVPIYGVEKYIARCAQSLLTQDYADKEILFVDDASADRSIEVLQSVVQKHPERDVRILRHTNNRGLAAARKTGLEAAKGEYIVNVDGDDYLEPNALRLLADRAAKTDADIIGMDCYFEWNEKRSIYCGQWSKDPQEYSRILLSGRTLPGVCLHMIRKSLYTQAGLAPVEGLNNGEDYVLTPRLCWFANRIERVEQPLYHYIQTNNASIAHAASQQYIRQLIQVVEILTSFFADKPDCAEALAAGQWLKKTDLMMKASKADYALIDTMPCSATPVLITMTCPQRVASRLIARRAWTILWLYSRCFNIMLETVQILKGRRKKC